MQAGNEGRAVDLSRTACPVAKANDVGATLLQPCRERKPFCVVREGYKSRVSVTVIAHEYGELPAGFEGMGTIADELTVSAKEVFERGRTGEIAVIVGIQLLTPIGRMGPDKIKCLGSRKVSGVAGIKTLVDVK